MPWLIVVDFDGTVTERDTQDALLERYAPDAYGRAEEGLQAGTLTLRECMTMEFAPVRGDHETLVAEAVQDARVRAGFSEFVRAVEAAGHRLVVVSGGFESIIRPILTREGAEHLPVIAHEVRFTPEGTTLEFRHGEDCDVCGQECKRSVVDELRNGHPVAYVGDGYSDRCAAVAADRRFARHSLARDLDRLGLSYTTFEDFHTVREALLGSGADLAPDPSAIT
jgi:2-hydroxy-3-keto-5-methylthiopentenyl-1-phosphate phosphatase